MTVDAQGNMLQIGKCDSYLSPLVLSAILEVSVQLMKFLSYLLLFDFETNRKKLSPTFRSEIEFFKKLGKKFA